MLKHIADRKITFPANIDVLICEQEVGTSDLPAVEVVLAADERRHQLNDRAAFIQARIDAGDEDESLSKELQKVDNRIKS